MIQPPKWAQGAYPTTRGWVKNGELLKSMKISQADVDAWHSTEVAPTPPQPVVVPTVEPETPDLNSMNKVELEEFARGEGIELDRRKSLKNMIKEYWSLKG